MVGPHEPLTHKVAAYARGARSGERGTEAAPATPDRYVPARIPMVGSVDFHQIGGISP